jgi:alpha-L-rhamnosidase
MEVSRGVPPDAQATLNRLVHAWSRAAVVLLCLWISLLGGCSRAPAIRWISLPGQNEGSAGVYSFRKIFSLAALPRSLVVQVSADIRFILYVNGRRMGDGPARGDLKHWRYETFDVAPALRVGENIVAARVWNFGPQAPAAQISYRPAFLLWAEDSSVLAVNTNESWQVRLERGWTFARTGPPVGSTVGPNENVDGSDYDWNWRRLPVGPEASGWQAAEPLDGPIFADPGEPAGNREWVLTADQLPPMEYAPVPAGRVVQSSGAAPGDFPDQPVEIPPHTSAPCCLTARF